MDTDDLRKFLRVAELGSIASAARTEGIDASTLSRQLAALEARLGIRLFQRSTRKMSLTEAGETFRSRLGPIMEDLDAARAAADDRMI